MRSRDTNVPNKWPLCWIYTPGFDVGPTVIIGLWFGIGLQSLYELNDRWWSCDVTSISKMAATASQIYFRFHFWRRIAFNNVQIYSHTKFRQDNSIRGWHITISGFWKQMAAILKFYFRFHVDVSVVISMWFSVSVPNFIQIGPSATELWRHNHFQDSGHSIATLLPVSALVT